MQTRKPGCRPKGIREPVRTFIQEHKGKQFILD